MAQGEKCQVANKCSKSSDRVYTNAHGTFCNKHYLHISRHGKIIEKTSRDERSAVMFQDYALLPLGIDAKGGYAKVDKEFAYLDKHKWVKTTLGYAICPTTKEMLHRLVVSCPSNKVIDHIDGDPLNNTQSNLRICTQAENSKNQKIKTRNTTGYKGVYLDKRFGKFVARVKHNYKTHYAGQFDSAIEAALAYNHLATKLHGDFARLNDVR